MTVRRLKAILEANILCDLPLYKIGTLVLTIS